MPQFRPFAAFRRFPRRRVATLALLIGLVECSQAADLSMSRQAIEIAAEPVALHTHDESRQTLGALRYRGGVALTSGHPAFGGLSGLWVAPDESRFMAISDKGHWVTSTLRHDSAGRLIGIGREGAIGNLGRPPPGGPEDPRGRDSEALTQTPNGGFLVSFEGQHRILAYPAADEGVALAAPATRVDTPPLLRRARSNGGPEALTALRDGRLVMLVESLTAGGARVGFLRDPVRDSGDWHRLAYPLHPDFKPTDAAELPGGDLLVVERRFDPLGGFQARLRRVPAARIRPGGQLSGEIVATFKPPFIVDNYEGLAVRTGADGTPHLYLVSDDNFQGLQRTLLLMFELAPK